MKKVSQAHYKLVTHFLSDKLSDIVIIDKSDSSEQVFVNWFME